MVRAAVPAPDDANAPMSSSRPAVRRLSLYLRQAETFAADGRETASSRDLGDALGLSDAQVRKDLARFGTFGQPGIGYRTGELVATLRRILGTDRQWPIVLVGAGNIGRALSAYRRFGDRGFRLAAVLDSDPNLAGRRLGPLRVRPVGQITAAVAETGARLAVLAVPAEAAQPTADLLVAAGVRGILNFAPVRLAVPPAVRVIDVDLAAQLEQLAFGVNMDGA